MAPVWEKPVEVLKENKEKADEVAARRTRREYEWTRLLCDPSEEAIPERERQLSDLACRIQEAQSLTVSQLDASEEALPGPPNWFRDAALEEMKIDRRELQRIRREQHQARRYAGNARYVEAYANLGEIFSLVVSDRRVVTKIKDTIHMGVIGAGSNYFTYLVAYPLLVKLFGPAALIPIGLFEGFTAITPVVPGGPGVTRLLTYAIIEGVIRGHGSYLSKMKRDSKFEKADVESRKQVWIRSVATSIGAGIPVAADFGWVLIPATEKVRRLAGGGLHRGMTSNIKNARLLQRLEEKYCGLPERKGETS